MGGYVQIAVTDIDIFRKIAGRESFKEEMNEQDYEGLRGKDYYRGSIDQCNYQVHDDLKSLMLPGLAQQSNLQSYIDPINSILNTHIVQLKSRERTGEPINLSEWTKMLSINIFANVLFRLDLDNDNQEDIKHLESLKIILDKYMSCVEDSIIMKYLTLFPELGFQISFIKYLQGYFHIKAKKDFESGKKILDILIAKQTISKDDFKEVADVYTKNDINTIHANDKYCHLDWGTQTGPGIEAKLLFVGTVKERYLTSQQIAINFTTLFTQGVIPTANLIAFAIHQLSVNKDKEKKLRDEIVQYGKDIDLSQDGLDKLPYLQAVIKETLRLYSPIIAATRKVTTDFKVREYDDPKNKTKGFKEDVIPQATMVRLPIRAIHLNEKYYSQPLEFHPERWLGDSSLIPKNPHAFIPFGYGQRLCLGQKLVEMTAQIALFKLYQNFSFNVNSSSKDIEVISNDKYLQSKKPIYVEIQGTKGKW